MKFLGFGLGLRSDHISEISSGPVRVDWFEAITENYLGLQAQGFGPGLPYLLKVREKSPIALHGVSLGIGSSDPLNLDYLKNVRDLRDIVEAEWVSDHICWSSLGGKHFHDLLPVSYHSDVLAHLCSKVERAQEFLQQPLILENVSSYISYRQDEMPEWEFIHRLVTRTGCKLLLDLNNIFVSSVNHGFAPQTYINHIPVNAVAQIHLAGPTEIEGYFIDTHDHPVKREVWDLYRHSLERFGAVSTMVEWDKEIPAYKVLEDEVLKAKAIFLQWKDRKNGMEEPSAQLR